MAYQASLTATQEELEAYSGAKLNVPLLYEPRYHIRAYDQPNMYIKTMRGPNELKPAIWSFIPVKEYHKKEYFERTYGDIKGFVFKHYSVEVRAEKIFINRVFKDAVIGSRCLIYADGFFKGTVKEKTGHYFYLPDEDGDRKLFAMAGVCSRLYEDVHTCAVVNIANEGSKAPYGRMPLVLEKGMESEWLRPDLTKKGIREFFKSSFTSEKLSFHNVSELIFGHGDQSKNPAVILPG